MLLEYVRRISPHVRPDVSILAVTEQTPALLERKNMSSIHCLASASSCCTLAWLLWVMTFMLLSPRSHFSELAIRQLLLLLFFLHFVYWDANKVRSRENAAGPYRYMIPMPETCVRGFKGKPYVFNQSMYL